MKHYIYSFKLGLLGGFILFFLFFVTAFFIQSNGLAFKGSLFLFFVGIFYYFWIIVVLGTWGFNNYIRENTTTLISFGKRFLLLSTFALICLAVYMILDNLYFLIDDSLSVEFVKYLKGMDEPIDLGDFNEYPFSYIAFTTPLGFLGVFVTMLLVKKDGQLIKNKQEEY